MRITDALGSSVTGAFKLATLGAVSITTAKLSAGTHGKPIKKSLKATGGLKPYTWTDTTRNLAAAGLNLDPNTGVISGTIATAGTTINFTVQVTDSMSGIDEQDLALTIK